MPRPKKYNTEEEAKIAKIELQRQRRNKTKQIIQQPPIIIYVDSKYIDDYIEAKMKLLTEKIIKEKILDIANKYDEYLREKISQLFINLDERLCDIEEKLEEITNNINNVDIEQLNSKLIELEEQVSILVEEMA